MKTFAQLTPNIRLSQAITSFVSHLQTKEQAKSHLKQAHAHLSKILNLKPSHILLTHGARAGLYALLQNIKKNNKSANQVVLSAYTCRVLINPIQKSELDPVFTDLDRQNLTTDLNDLQSKLSSKTLAVVIQNTFGTYDDWKVIAELVKSKAPKAKLICDNAHFLPNKAEFAEQAKYFDYAIFSFGTNKILSASMLGALISFQRPLAANISSSLDNLPTKQAHLLLFKNWYFYISLKLYSLCKIGKCMLFAVSKLNLVPKVVSDSEKKLIHTNVAYYKASSLLGFSLLSALKYYQTEITHRVLIKSIYQCNLKKSLQYDKWFRKAPIFFPIQVSNPRKLYKKLLKKGFQTNLDWTDSMLVPASQTLPPDYQESNYPSSKYVSKHTLCLPLNKTVKPSDAVKIVELINQYAK